MERLTEKRPVELDYGYKTKDFVYTEEAIQKLAEYEDAEEQGRLIILPCKEGDEVFEPRDSISGQSMRSGTVQRFEIKNGNIKVMTTIGMFNAWDFGKTVFLADMQKGN